MLISEIEAGRGLGVITIFLIFIEMALEWQSDFLPEPQNKITLVPFFLSTGYSSNEVL